MWSLSLSVDIALSNEAMFMGLKCFAKPASPVCLWSVWPSSPIGLCMSVTTKIGLGLTGFGIFFTFLGIIFFFDKGLLAMGNVCLVTTEFPFQILFIAGVSLTIGLKSTMQFFMKRQNYKGTISFGVGFFFVVIGWPILGMILETYGFIVLFSGFWPTLSVFLQRIPILGWLFQQPFVRSNRTLKSGIKAKKGFIQFSFLNYLLVSCLKLVHVPNSNPSKLHSNRRYENGVFEYQSLGSWAYLRNGYLA
ncbi:hypothetical protein WN943_023801 [Citrus x changshan-huyou]